MYSILICDDDRDIVNALKIYLSDPQYKLYEAYNGEEALQVMKENEIQLILMDIMMPQMDGMEAMVKIRESSNVPIILLTAKSEDNDKILGLNVGADDYITKPFNPIEVNARVRSQLRRYTQLGSAQMAPEKIVIDGIALDNEAKTVTLDGAPVSLTPTEFDILKLLMMHEGKVFSPKEIYMNVWKEEAVGNESTTVAVHIRHLREKLEIDPNEPRNLKVVWGQGYKMEGRHEKQTL
ncbi:MAG: response regulator transcription factor [Solobacterium sp.]|jgi:DNA-binding response OmpR family regulator|nr:response regulator transcription factor [Solobacterium sp.]MCH4205469.1 response regulator transcription factor [Solobacterium sp.]MCH4226993.1 response regulator transcription factor [Solobacterium sp.]MCH4282156.1 response regulator transcription factor [Solobacterium sp.]